MKNCPTCTRPANDRYTNAAAGEVCVDRSHDPYLTIAQRLYAETQREAIASRGVKIVVVPQTVPTTASPHHPSATHVDVLGMPVAGVDEFPFHPTPCCGAAASVSDGPMYCKACYEEVDDAFGNVPVTPFTSLGGAR